MGICEKLKDKLLRSVLFMGIQNEFYDNKSFTDMRVVRGDDDFLQPVTEDY